MPVGSRSTGEDITGATPLLAAAIGIRMVFQELSDAPPLTVTENICLGRWPTRRGRVDWRAARERAVAALARLGSDIDPDRTVRLAAHRRASGRRDRPGAWGNTRCLILDEPTAALSAGESDRLFDIILRLRSTGVAIIYITHRLDEVRRIADRVQVLRDGATVLEGAVADHDRNALVEAMVGRPVDATKRPEATRPGSGCRSGHQGPRPRVGSVVRRCQLRTPPRRDPRAVRAGRRGHPGSGRDDLRRSRRRPPGRSSSGDGCRRSTARRRRSGCGIGLLPGDRQREGALMNRSVAENLCAASWPTLSRRGVITGRREATAYRRWHDRLHIRSRNDPRQTMSTLSGGNQQKVLLGRWLERDVKVLVLVEPTRGVDVGAREEIYRAIRALDGAGTRRARGDERSRGGGPVGRPRADHGARTYRQGVGRGPDRRR